MIISPRTVLLAGLTLSGWLAACAPASPVPTAEPSPTPIDAPVAQVTAHLAGLLGVPGSEIVIGHVEPATWPDSALGCPQPGLNYTQTVVEGAVVVLSYQGQDYEYHTGGAAFVLCTPLPTPTPSGGVVQLTPQVTPEGGTSMPPTPPIHPGLESLVEEAVADLAKRLSIEASEIDVLLAETVIWRDSSLGCPQPGMMYLQVLTDGYRILLQSGGQTYAYHGGRNQGPFLCQNPQP